MLTKVGLLLALLCACGHASRQSHSSHRHRTSTWMRSHREYLTVYLSAKRKESSTIILTCCSTSLRPSWKKMRGGSSLSNASPSSSSVRLTFHGMDNVPSLGTPIYADLDQIQTFSRVSKILPSYVPKDWTVRSSSLDQSSSPILDARYGRVRTSMISTLFSEVVLFAGSHLEPFHMALWNVLRKWVKPRTLASES